MIIPCKDIQSKSDVSYKDQLWTLMSEQRKEGQLCDVVIECNGQQFYAHGIVLACVSPYFKANLLGSFKLSSIEGKQQFELSDFACSSVKLLLDLAYEVDTTTVNVDIIDFIQLLDYVQIDSYYGAILEAIRPYVSIDNCLEIFQLCNVCNVQSISKPLSVFIYRK